MRWQRIGWRLGTAGQPVDGVAITHPFKSCEVDIGYTLDAEHELVPMEHAIQIG
jgi:hypothetical protein